MPYIEVVLVCVRYFGVLNVFNYVLACSFNILKDFTPNFNSTSYITAYVDLICISNKRSQKQGGPLLNVTLHFNLHECFTVS